MLVHWIWLATREHISDRVRAELLRHFRDPEDIYFAAGDAFDHLQIVTEAEKTALRDKDLRQSREILDECARKGIHILTLRDAAYPGRLKNIPDPPVVLYYKGNLPDFDDLPLMGIVGTRRASAYGLGAAKRMGYQIAKCGGAIVSGVAGGIDSAAMRGALTAGGTVIGVLGCGADVVYPPFNLPLYRDTERYGCLLTEYPPGTPPRGSNFPRRNRIISGIGCGVLVVEAPEKSGAMITARLAADQGRDVFAVPGNIDVPTFAGSNRLLREGAILVTTGWDVMCEYQAQYPDMIHRADAPAHQAGYPDEVEKAAISGKKAARKKEKAEIPEKKPASAEENDKIVIDNGVLAPYSDVNKPKPELSDDERILVDALTAEPRLLDEVIAETGLGAGAVLSMLTVLEIRGVVKRHPGRRISLK